MHKLNDLKTWNKAMDLTQKIYELSVDFPVEEKYGLTSQIRRSAISIPSNVAEGAGRVTNGEFRNFISIASGSSYELFTQLILAHRLNLTSKYKTQPVINDVLEVQKMLYSLYRYLQK